jgi:hypothetical protein
MRFGAKLTRAVAALVLTLGAVTGSTLVGGGPAAAADRCSGTLIEERNITTGTSGVIGYLNVYWDGHYNCAETVSASKDWGVLKQMGVWIYSCPLSDKGGSTCHTISKDQDYDGYAYYAGPVRVDGRNRCVAAEGYILWPSTDGGARTNPYVGHC